MARERNERLASLLLEAGWSRAQATAAYNRVAAETLNGEVLENSKIGRSHVSMWVGGVQPSGIAPAILCQALSRRLKREITSQEIGFTAATLPAQEALDWRVDPLIALSDLGNGVNTDRRRLLAGGVYSAAALILPDATWWEAMAEPCGRGVRGSQTGGLRRRRDRTGTDPGVLTHGPTARGRARPTGRRRIPEA